MSKHDQVGVEFSGNNSEQQLWEQLRDIPQPDPSPGLRQSFYRALDNAIQPTWGERCRRFLGLSGAPGLITVSASLFFGLVVGLALNNAGKVDMQTFSALQQQVASLNHTLILGRLNSSSANTRLLGVVEASGFVEHDAEIAKALLTLAKNDKVYSIRSAAIEALGPELNNADIGQDLMALFEQQQSPLVQLALVDLVLRYGNAAQIDRLTQLNRAGDLAPELSEYVQSAVKGNSI